MSKHDPVMAKPKPDAEIQPVGNFVGILTSFLFNRDAIYDRFLLSTPDGDKTVSPPTPTRVNS